MPSHQRVCLDWAEGAPRGLVQLALLLAFRPTTLGMLTALGMLWVYVLHVRRDEMNVLGVRLGVRAQAIALLVLTLGVVFFLTNAAAMLSSVCSAGVAVAVAHSALRKPQQDIQAEAEGDGTLYKGFTSFVESNLSNEALSKVCASMCVCVCVERQSPTKAFRRWFPNSGVCLATPAGGPRGALGARVRSATAT